MDTVSRRVSEKAAVAASPSPSHAAGSVPFRSTDALRAPASIPAGRFAVAAERSAPFGRNTAARFAAPTSSCTDTSTRSVSTAARDATGCAACRIVSATAGAASSSAAAKSAAGSACPSAGSTQNPSDGSAKPSAGTAKSPAGSVRFSAGSPKERTAWAISSEGTSDDGRRRYHTTATATTAATATAPRINGTMRRRPALRRGRTALRATSCSNSANLSECPPYTESYPSTASARNGSAIASRSRRLASRPRRLPNM